MIDQTNQQAPNHTMNEHDSAMPMASGDADLNVMVTHKGPITRDNFVMHYMKNNPMITDAKEMANKTFDMIVNHPFNEEKATVGVDLDNDGNSDLEITVDFSDTPQKTENNLGEDSPTQNRVTSMPIDAENVTVNNAIEASSEVGSGRTSFTSVGSDARQLLTGDIDSKMHPDVVEDHLIGRGYAYVDSDSGELRLTNKGKHLLEHANGRGVFGEEDRGTKLPKTHVIFIIKEFDDLLDKARENANANPNIKHILSKITDEDKNAALLQLIDGGFATIDDTSDKVAHTTAKGVILLGNFIIGSEDLPLTLSQHIDSFMHRLSTETLETDTMGGTDQEGLLIIAPLAETETDTMGGTDQEGPLNIAPLAETIAELLDRSNINSAHARSDIANELINGGFFTQDSGKPAEITPKGKELVVYLNSSPEASIKEGMDAVDQTRLDAIQGTLPAQITDISTKAVDYITDNALDESVEISFATVDGVLIQNNGNLSHKSDIIWGNETLNLTPPEASSQEKEKTAAKLIQGGFAAVNLTYNELELTHSGKELLERYLDYQKANNDAYPTIEHIISRHENLSDPRANVGALRPTETMETKIEPTTTLTDNNN